MLGILIAFILFGIFMFIHKIYEMKKRKTLWRIWAKELGEKGGLNVTERCITLLI